MDLKRHGTGSYQKLITNYLISYQRNNKLSVKKVFLTFKAYIVPLLYLFLSFYLSRNKPLVGYFDGGGFVHIAHNYHKYGYLSNFFAQIKFKNYDGSYSLYANHPPLISIIVSLIYPIFSDKPELLRIIPIFFSTITLLLIYKIFKHIFHVNSVYAMIAQTTIAISPMFATFSRIINHEPFLLCLFLCFVYFFYISLKYNKHRFYLYLLSFISIWFDIPGLYFSIVIIPLFFLYIRDRHTRNLILSILLVQSISFWLFLQYTKLITNTNPIQFFVSITKDRLGNFLDNRQYLIMLTSIIDHYLTFPYFFISTLSVVFLILSKIENKIYLIILLLFGIVHVLLFQKASFYHPFWFFYIFSIFVTLPILYAGVFKHKIISLLIIVSTLTIIPKWVNFTSKVYNQQDMASLDIANNLTKINSMYCTLNFDPINLIALYAKSNYIPIDNTIPEYCDTLVTDINFQTKSDYHIFYKNNLYKILIKDE